MADDYDEQLIVICEVIHELLDKRDAINSEIRDVYDGARDRKYHSAALRKLITLSRKHSNWRELLSNEAKAQQLYSSQVSKYLPALDALKAGKLTQKEVADTTGISLRTVERLAELVPPKKEKDGGSPQTEDESDTDSEL